MTAPGAASPLVPPWLRIGRLAIWTQFCPRELYVGLVWPKRQAGATVVWVNPLPCCQIVFCLLPSAKAQDLDGAFVNLKPYRACARKESES